MGKKGVLLTIGPLLVILGGCPLLLIWTFAAFGMVRPNPEGWDYWSILFGKMFNFEDNTGWICLPALTVVMLGCALFIWGLVVAIDDLVKRKSTRS